MKTQHKALPLPTLAEDIRADRVDAACSVDQMLIDSFPASDPPSWTASAGVPAQPATASTPRPRVDRPSDDTLLLFYSPHATSLPALLTLLRLREPFRLCRVELDERTLGHFSFIHPWSPPPLLRTERGDLGEQLAILMHLGLRGSRAGLLPPPGTQARDRFFELFGFLERRVLPSLELLGDIESFERSPKTVRDLAGANLLEALQRLDRQLDAGPYLLGSSYSVLDALFFGLGRWAARHLDLEHCTPAVHRYLLRLTAEPEAQMALRLLAGAPLPGPVPHFLGPVELQVLSQDAA